MLVGGLLARLAGWADCRAGDAGEQVDVMLVTAIASYVVDPTEGFESKRR